MKSVKPYREVLQECLIKRLSGNPRYSLRAFARDIGVSPSQLSNVLNGKRGISPEKASRVFDTLPIGNEERQQALLQVKKEHARSSVAKRLAGKELLEISQPEHFQLTRDAFSIISDWYHFAVLQALSLKKNTTFHSAEKQCKWIALRLGIQEVEVKLAIERMQRLELVSSDVHGRLKVSHETVLSSDGVPSSALRQFHKQVIQKSLLAIESQPVEERYSNTVMLPMLKTSIPIIQKDILEFQKKMMKKHGRTSESDGDVVYALSQQFFKLMEA